MQPTSIFRLSPLRCVLLRLNSPVCSLVVVVVGEKQGLVRSGTSCFLVLHRHDPSQDQQSCYERHKSSTTLNHWWPQRRQPSMLDSSKNERFVGLPSFFQGLAPQTHYCGTDCDGRFPVSPRPTRINLSIYIFPYHYKDITDMTPNNKTTTKENGSPNSTFLVLKIHKRACTPSIVTTDNAGGGATILSIFTITDLRGFYICTRIHRLSFAIYVVIMHEGLCLSYANWPLYFWFLA